MPVESRLALRRPAIGCRRFFSGFHDIVILWLAGMEHDSATTLFLPVIAAPASRASSHSRYSPGFIPVTPITVTLETEAGRRLPGTPYARDISSPASTPAPQAVEYEATTVLREQLSPRHVARNIVQEGANLARVQGIPYQNRKPLGFGPLFL